MNARFYQDAASCPKIPGADQNLTQFFSSTTGVGIYKWPLGNARTDRVGFDGIASGSSVSRVEQWATPDNCYADAKDSAIQDPRDVTLLT